MPIIKPFKVRSGTEINGYEIVESLGRGWEGEVYRAKEHFSGGFRVLKLFDPAQYRSKQITEYCAKLERISDVPGVIRYYHAGYWEHKDSYYMVMEYYEGKDLGQLCTKQWPFFKAFNTVYKLCQIVSNCHARGECIGDIDPCNILMDDAGELKIIDFNYGAKFKNSHMDDVVAICKLIYRLVSSQSVPGDLRYVLPKRRNAIRDKYNSIDDVLEALDMLSGK